MIPLVSSLDYGPAGYCQLPRLWWKSLLHAHGQLDPDYPASSIMLDRWLLVGFEIPQEEVQAYVQSEKPNYLTFENWVLENARRKPDPVSRDAWNLLINTRIHRPEKLFEITSLLGLDLEPDLVSAVILNHLEDWHYFYRRDFPEIDKESGPVVPLISSSDYGRLGICQLPRTWLKVILEARGALHPDYPGCGNGLDARVLEVLKLDRDETVEYLKEQTPSYADFELWVRRQKGDWFHRGAVDEWNEYIRNRIHNPEKRKSILTYLGLPDDGRISSAVVLNQIEDWEYAWRELGAVD